MMDALVDKETNMAPRQIPGRLYRWLVEEIRFWQERELVSADQAERILACYEARKPGIALGLPVSSVFCGIGGTLIALASLLVIHALRNVVSPEVRLGVVWLVFFAWHGLIFLPSGSDSFQRALREGLLLGTGIYFGGALFFIPEIFNLSMHTVWGTCLWALGIWGVAFLLKDILLLQSLLISGLLLTALTESNVRVDLLRLGSYRSLVTHASVVILTLIVLTSLLWLAWKRKNQLAILCFLGALALWFLLAVPRELTGERESCTFAMTAAVGAVLWLCGEILPAGAIVAEGCMIGGGLLSLIGWGFLNSRQLYGYEATPAISPFGTFLVVLRMSMIVIVTIALIAAAWKQVQRGQDTTAVRRELLGRTALPVICILLSLLIWLCQYFGILAGAALSVEKMGALLLAVGGIGVLAVGNVVQGLNRGRVSQAGVGLLAFLVGISVWWSNFFGYSELAGAGLFAAAGLALVGGALYWMRRRSRAKFQTEPSAELASSEGESDSTGYLMASTERRTIRLRHLVVLLLQTTILGAVMWATFLNWLPWTRS